MLLDEIGRKYNTDKASHAHDYLKYYEKFIDFQPQYILEIGVAYGASLCMWQERYDCTVYGVDLFPCKFESDEIKLRIGDQKDAVFLTQVCQEIVPNAFDLVIDDASHQSMDTICTFEILFPLLKTGGLYICEDTCCSYWPGFANTIPTPIEFFKQLVDVVHLDGFRPMNEQGGVVNQRSMEILSCYDPILAIKYPVEYMIFVNGAVLIKKR